MARLAKALVTLRTQIDTAYPNRSKASDGWLGDAAHAATVSQHNPNAAGVVTALDITHDPAHGVDGQALANGLITDNRTWYVIFNRRIWENESWKAYNGPNPHDKHLHISTKQNPGNYDNPANWNIGGTDMPRVRIPPEIVAQHYANFVNRPDIKPTDPVCQNRFEDTVDDEFWYGLIFMMNDQKKAFEKEIASLKKQLADSTANFVPAGQLYVKKV